MKCRLKLLASVGLIIVLAVSAASAFADWPQWRGPNRDGHSSDTGLLKQWPEGGPKLVWKTTGLGLGFAGVSVVGDRLFAAGDKGDSNYLMAIRGSDGNILWTTKVGKSGRLGSQNTAGPRCTPTVDGNRVIAIGQYGEILCADAATGAEICARTISRTSTA